MSPFAANLSDRRSPAAHFLVRARAEPGVMPRVLELFAKRGLVPSLWLARTAAEDELTIEVEMPGLAREAMDYLAASMRQIASVAVVLASERSSLSAP
jgi:acetolactate synthase small subunit